MKTSRDFVATNGETISEIPAHPGNPSEFTGFFGAVYEIHFKNARSSDFRSAFFIS